MGLPWEAFFLNIGGHPSPEAPHPASSTLHPAPCIRHPAPRTLTFYLYLLPSTFPQHPHFVSCTPHPASFSLSTVNSHLSTDYWPLIPHPAPLSTINYQLSTINSPLITDHRPLILHPASSIIFTINC
jgi:hypothetical protein